MALVTEEGGVGGIDAESTSVDPRTIFTYLAVEKCRRTTGVHTDFRELLECSSANNMFILNRKRLWEESARHEMMKRTRSVDPSWFPRVFNSNRMARENVMTARSLNTRANRRPGLAAGIALLYFCN